MEFIAQLREPRDKPESTSRRRFLQAALPAAAAVPLFAAEKPSGVNSLAVRNGPRVESRLFGYDNPADHQRQSYRILRNAHDEADVLFWYHFTMFSVPVGRAPQPVVRWEGIEFSHHRKLVDGVYRVHGHNLSFPRDLRSGQWTDSTLNPVTGVTVEVPPMALTEDPGYLNMPEGVIPLDKPDAEPRTRLEQFLIEDDLVKIEQVRLPPASWPATFVETSANWSDRALFEADELPSLPAGTAGGYVFPWPEWMAMGETPGHMFATWHGRKLNGVDDLPETFLARAEIDHADLLGVDLSVFDVPLPGSLAGRVDNGMS